MRKYMTADPTDIIEKDRLQNGQLPNRYSSLNLQFYYGPISVQKKLY